MSQITLTPRARRLLEIMVQPTVVDLHQSARGVLRDTLDRLEANGYGPHVGMLPYKGKYLISALGRCALADPDHMLPTMVSYGKGVNGRDRLIGAAIYGLSVMRSVDPEFAGVHGVANLAADVYYEAVDEDLVAG